MRAPNAQGGVVARVGTGSNDTTATTGVSFVAIDGMATDAGLSVPAEAGVVIFFGNATAIVRGHVAVGGNTPIEGCAVLDPGVPVVVREVGASNVWGGQRGGESGRCAGVPPARCPSRFRCCEVLGTNTRESWSGVLLSHKLTGVRAWDGVIQ